MVGEKYFQEHNKVRHGSTCPDESVDIFKLPEAKDTQSYLEEMTTKDFPDLLKDMPLDELWPCIDKDHATV